MNGRFDSLMVERAAKVRPPLRVVLVDDHEVVRTGLREILAGAGMEVVGEAGDVATAVSIVDRTAPDVVVLDVRLPGGGGPAVLAELEDDVRVLACSASDERDDVLATVRAGALGYVLKTAVADELISAVRSTAGGDPVFSAELAGHLLDADLEAASDGVVDEQWQQLTDREREVLRYLARGRTYKQIAEELVVSPKTVETHVRNILQKLQVSNRHEAARWALDPNLD